MDLGLAENSHSPFGASKYVALGDLELQLHLSNSNSGFPLFDAAAVAPAPPPLEHSFVADIKAAGMEKIARDSGLLTDSGAIPTLRVSRRPSLDPSAPPTATSPSAAAAAAAAAPAAAATLPAASASPSVFGSAAAVVAAGASPAGAAALLVKREKDESEMYDDSSASYASPVKRGRSRGRTTANSNRSSSVKRSKSASSSGAGSQDKASIQAKGLRHFSLAVCNKVRFKGVTTYNEVADELVVDFDDDDGKNDEKNIRRRVYDALNVLSAMDIIRKVKKEIHWVGLPATNTDQLELLQQEHASRAERVSRKEEHLSELAMQLSLYKAVISRNASNVASTSDKLALPFIIVNADNKCKIDLRVSSDRTEYVFDFTSPFELRDDPDILAEIFQSPNKK